MKDADGNELFIGDLVYWRIDPLNEDGTNGGFLDTQIGVIKTQPYGKWVDVKSCKTQLTLSKYPSNLRKVPPEIEMLYKLENL